MAAFPLIPFDYPLIRDTLVIDERVADFVKNFESAGAIYLLAREIRFAPPADPRKPLVLSPGTNELIIMADRFDGSGGFIDARGGPPDPLGAGAAGAAGAAGLPSRPGTPWRPKAGGRGLPGGPGTREGLPGGRVTLMCREAVNVRASVRGGVGAPGGRGGRGGPGCSGYVGIADDPDQVMAGTRGGYGGKGGPGARGGPGGTLTYVGIAEPSGMVLETGGGPGGPGGANGAAGSDGAYYVPPEDQPAPDENWPMTGDQGPDGSGPPLAYELVGPAEFVQRMRATLGVVANYWAPFRLVVGEYFYRHYHPGDGSDNGARAAAELERALEFQPDNAQALRLKQQLVGTLAIVPGTDVEVWQGGGLNVLGLPRDLDILPRFRDFQDAYTAFAALSLGLLGSSTGAALNEVLQTSLRSLADAQVTEATIAADNARRQQTIAEHEAEDAKTETTYRQGQLDKLTADIKAALAEMEQHEFSIGAFFGTVASVAGAVISIVAAIPSGGASLVALAPSLISLSKIVVDNAGPVTDALFSGGKPPLEEVSRAAKEVGKESQDIVKAGQAVANFVTVVQNIAAGSTPDNAKYVALVKEGAIAAHEVLLSRNRQAIAAQRAEAAQAATSGAEALVAAMKNAGNQISDQAQSMRRLALVAADIARAKMDVLLNFAFRAQRSVEIVTLRDETANVMFDAGMLHPDTARGYWEGWVDGATMLAELSSAWGKLQQPATITQHFLDFVSDPDRDHDVLARSFDEANVLAAFRATGTLSFAIEPGPRGRLEAKARNVAIALIGAAPGDDVISCEITHDGRYGQLVTPAGPPEVELLLARTSTRVASLIPLSSAPDIDGDFTLTNPEALAFWGRGIGGQWTITVPRDGMVNTAVDLSNVTAVQIWIGYQFLRT